MISSNDVSQMIASQNSMFSGQNSFANQIGVSAPGIGMSGYGAPAQAPQPHIPGMHGSPTPFNYGGGTFMSHGYASGNRVASNVMSGIGGAATAAGVGVGAAAMFGKLGVAAPFVDPFSMFGAARTMGASTGMAMGAAALPMAGAMAVGAGFNAFMHGGQQQSMMNTTMGNYQFFNPASRTGMGFNRQDTAAMGDQIRQMSHIPEMLTSVGELTKIMGMMKNIGNMQGIKDVSEFSKRFKEAIGTIRETAKMLGTTMEEATQFFAHSRNVGFLGSQSQLKNALNAQFTSGVTGMSVGQVMQLQQSGANMATQIGGQRGVGARAVTSIADAIGAAQRGGHLTNGLLENITGTSGAEAVQIASQQLTAGLVQVGQSAAGRLVMAGLVQFDERGRAMGLDEGLVQQFNAGTLSTSDLKKRAGSLTERQKASFVHRSGELSMNLAAQVGPGGIARFMDELVGDKYGDEGTGILLNRVSGLSSQQADLMMELRNTGSMDADRMSMERIQGRESKIKEKMDPSAIIKRVKTQLHAGLFGGLEQAGADVYSGIAKVYEDFWDDVLGRHVVELTKEGAQAFSRALSGGSDKELKSMFAAAAGLDPQTYVPKTGKHTLFGGGVGALGGALSGAVAGSMIPVAGTLVGAGAGAVLGGIGGASFADEIFGGFQKMIRRDTYSTGAGPIDDAKEFMGLVGAGTGFRGSISGLVKALESGALTGITPGNTLGGDILSRMAIGTPEYMKMDEAKKLEAMRGSVSSRVQAGLSKTFGEGRAWNGLGQAADEARNNPSLLSALSVKDSEAAFLLEAASKIPGGMDAATGVVFGLQNNRSPFKIDATKIIGAHKLSQFTSVEGRKRALADAEESEGFRNLSNTAKVALKGNKNIRAATLAALNDPAVASAILEGNSETILEKLRSKGIRLSSGDIEALKGVYAEVSSSGNAKGAIELVDMAAKGAEAEVLFQAFTAGGDKITESITTDGARTRLGETAMGLLTAVGKDMTALGDSRNAGAYDENIKSWKDNFGKLAELVSSEKDSSRQEDIIRASGDLAPGLRRAVAAKKRLSGLRGSKVTQDGIASALGIAKGDTQAMDAIHNAGITGTGSVKLSDDMISSLVKNMSGLDASRGMVGKEGDSEVAGTERKLLTVLEKLDKTIDLNTTLLSTFKPKEPNQSRPEDGGRETNAAQ